MLERVVERERKRREICWKRVQNLAKSRTWFIEKQVKLRCFNIIPENQGIYNLLLVVKVECRVKSVSKGKVSNLMIKLVLVQFFVLSDAYHSWAMCYSPL